MSGISLKGTSTGCDVIFGGATIASFGADGAADDSVVIKKRASRSLLASGTANNSASVIFTWNPAGFDHYELVFDRVFLAVAAQACFVRPSVDGGASFISSGYFTASLDLNYNLGGVNSGAANGTDSGYRIAGSQSSDTSNANNFGSSGILRTSSNKFSVCATEYVYIGDAGGICRQVNGSGLLNNSVVVNALQIIASSGLITSGTFRLYGIR